MPVSLKTRLDRFLIYLAPLRRIADAMQLKADGGDIIAWLSLLKVFGPNLDLGSDSIMVRQYPPIMGFDRDILPLDILRRGGRREPNACADDRWIRAGNERQASQPDD